MDNLSTKEKILHSAFKAFLKSGYKDVSVNEVVREIGLTKGGFYHYFKSKEDLCTEIIESYCFNFLHEFEIIISDPARSIKDKLGQASCLIIKMLDFNEQEGIEYGSLLLLIYDSMKRFDHLEEHAKNLYHHIYYLVLSQFSEAQLKGTIKPELDPGALAMTLVTLIEGIFFMSVMFDNGILKAKVPEMVNNFWLQIENRN